MSDKREQVRGDFASDVRAAFREAVEQKARADAAEAELERLRTGMAGFGFTLGRNPDGVDDTVAATLLVVAELKDRLAASHRGENEAVAARDTAEAELGQLRDECEKRGLPVGLAGLLRHVEGNAALTAEFNKMAAERERDAAIKERDEMRANATRGPATGYGRP